MRSNEEHGDRPGKNTRPEEGNMTTDVQFISIPEWGRRVGLSKDSAYKAARLGQIPGCFAVGRLYRVNWSAFVERSGLAGGQQAVEEVGGVLDTTFDHVSVRPNVVEASECHSRPAMVRTSPGRPDRRTGAVMP